MNAGLLVSDSLGGAGGGGGGGLLSFLPDCAAAVIKIITMKSGARNVVSLRRDIVKKRTPHRSRHAPHMIAEFVG